jgi:hypothetical protein
MSRGISVSSMYCVIINKSLCKNYIPLLFYNSDDIITSRAKLKFSLTPFCKRQVVTPVLSSQSSEIKGQKRSAKTS